MFKLKSTDIASMVYDKPYYSDGEVCKYNIDGKEFIFSNLFEKRDLHYKNSNRQHITILDILLACNTGFKKVKANKSYEYYLTGKGYGCIDLSGCNKPNNMTRYDVSVDSAVVRLTGAKRLSCLSHSEMLKIKNILDKFRVVVRPFDAADVQSVLDKISESYGQWKHRNIIFLRMHPCKVRPIVVESLLQGIPLCREPIDFDDGYSLADINRIASILRGVIPKYTKQQLICYIKL